MNQQRNYANVAFNILKMSFVKVVLLYLYFINTQCQILHSCPVLQWLTSNICTDAHPENHAHTFHYFIQSRNPGVGRVTQRPACRVSTAHTLLQHSQQSGSEHTTSYIAAAAGESWHCIDIYSAVTSRSSTFGPGWEWSCAWARAEQQPAVNVYIAQYRVRSDMGLVTRASNELTLRLHNHVRRLLTVG